MVVKANAGTKPWLAWRMLVVCAIVFLATYWTDGGDTPLRWTVVVLYFIAACTCMIKERVMYGSGDRIAVYEMWLILALTVIADVFDNHPYGFLSIFAFLMAWMMLNQVLKDTRKRLISVEPY